MTSFEIESLLRRTHRWWAIAFVMALVGFLGALAGPETKVGNAGVILVVLALLSGFVITVAGIALTAMLARSKSG